MPLQFEPVASLGKANFVLYCDVCFVFFSHRNVFGTVSAKIAPRLKCYKNASRLKRYNFPTDNAINFLFSTLHSEIGVVRSVENRKSIALSVGKL